MQALEDHEDPVAVLRVDADAVVAHDEVPAAVFTRGRDVDDRRRFAAELHGVADEVLEQLLELRRVGHDGGQGSAPDLRAALLDSAHQEGPAPLHDGLAVGRLHLLAARPHARVAEQVVDQLLHARGAVDGVADELVGVVVELAPIAPRSSCVKLATMRSGSWRSCDAT